MSGQTGTKRCTLEWCLFEALRDQERAFLKHASSICIALDERQGRLLLMFSACHKLEVCTGVLGQLQHEGKTAVDVASCVFKAIRSFCTTRLRHAHMNRTYVKAKRLVKTEQRIVGRVEMFCADGASNEQLAGRLLHPNVERGSDMEELPALK